MENYESQDSEQFDKIIDQLRERARKMGLYLQHAGIVTDSKDPELQKHDKSVVEAIKNGEAKFALVCSFAVGDIAWDLRTQDPDQFKVDQQFREIMPTDAEMKRDAIEQKMREKGGALDEDDIFGLFDDPE